MISRKERKARKAEMRRIGRQALAIHKADNGIPNAESNEKLKELLIEAIALTGRKEEDA